MSYLCDDGPWPSLFPSKKDRPDLRCGLFVWGGLFSEGPAIARLRATGASSLHISTSVHVVGLSGQYKNPDSTPYQYFGHGFWMYFFNNETFCSDCGIDAWHWMVQQIQ